MGTSRAIQVEDYRRMLGQFGVTGDMAVQQVESLSGGQKSRVAFAGRGDNISLVLRRVSTISFSAVWTQSQLPDSWRAHKPSGHWDYWSPRSCAHQVRIHQSKNWQSDEEIIIAHPFTSIKPLFLKVQGRCNLSVSRRTSSEDGLSRTVGV